ncbi:purine-nucleoside phosphorylase [Dietzia kunjamensis]|uniref:purine-nucleoside phosphorylase n=1 Tax=Dietzia TaxID=37914 RepID=UPI000805FF2E|nr:MULTISPECIES: purine-nucleoside phosphorylase [Dietzia]OAV79268.1 purine-nucleoside phosphorylase [Dietzia sp. 111N12-1]RKE58509.1 purine-nucleoside phosphorylase [Dietzia kunjamensis]
MAPLLTPTDEARAAAARIADLSGRGHHDVALVLGSGWSEVVTGLADPGSAVTIAPADLPGFATPAVAGHRGTVTSCLVDGVPLLSVAGRTHLYEGRGTGPVVHPAHVAAAAGARALVLTNAAGGLRDDLAVGDLVLIRDHLNLTARSPLTGPLFVDMVDAYSPRLRAAAADAMAAVDVGRPSEGVYAAMPGPQYETPAEINMLRTLGADLVGMSTVPETITARGLGLDVVAVSLVTNLAAGVTGQPLDHSEVLAAGAAGSARLTGALRALVPAVARC